MNILVIHAHTDNRGDEAAIKAMISSMRVYYPNAKISIFINGRTKYPCLNGIDQYDRFPLFHSVISKIDFYLILLSKGLLSCTYHGKQFVSLIKKADIVIHAPGGPSIGDIYYGEELLYLKRLELIRRLHKLYYFYAPSMGPFYRKNPFRNALRRRVLQGASTIVLRDPLSLKYLKDFIPNISAELTCDSVFQVDINTELNEKILRNDKALHDFLNKHDKCVGITITDLLWHPKYRKGTLFLRIKETFSDFVSWLRELGYGVLFIPQQYGYGDDYTLMKSFVTDEGCFVLNTINDNEDAIFQQYLVSKMFAMVGMRYHSNVFAIKSEVPCIAISYEQKTIGMIREIGYEDYCIDVNELSFKLLCEKFIMIQEHYAQYKNDLHIKHKQLQQSSLRTTKLLVDIIEEYVRGLSND